MDAQQNNGSQPRALTSVPAAVLTNTCSDAVLNVDGYCVKNDPRVRTSALPRRILPATSKPSDTMPSLASPTSAFTPLTHCQMEENEDNFAHVRKLLPICCSITQQSADGFVTVIDNRNEKCIWYIPVN